MVGLEVDHAVCLPHPCLPRLAEFLFQRRKVAPRVGDLLIAPTAFTHTHRGNRPQGGDKFIATSWILFQPAEKLYARG